MSNGIVIAPTMSAEELDRQIAIEICDLAEAAMKEALQLNKDLYGEVIKRRMAQNPTIGDFEKDKRGLQLKFSMPQELDAALKLVAPDGMKDYWKNYDFMKFLKE